MAENKSVDTDRHIDMERDKLPESYEDFNAIARQWAEIQAPGTGQGNDDNHYTPGIDRENNHDAASATYPEGDDDDELARCFSMVTNMTEDAIKAIESASDIPPPESFADSRHNSDSRRRDAIVKSHKAFGEHVDGFAEKVAFLKRKEEQLQIREEELKNREGNIQARERNIDLAEQKLATKTEEETVTLRHQVAELQTELNGERELRTNQLAELQAKWDREREQRAAASEQLIKLRTYLDKEREHRTREANQLNELRKELDSKREHLQMGANQHGILESAFKEERHQRVREANRVAQLQNELEQERAKYAEDLGRWQDIDLGNELEVAELTVTKHIHERTIEELKTELLALRPLQEEEAPPNTLQEIAAADELSGSVPLESGLPPSDISIASFVTALTPPNPVLPQWTELRPNNDDSSVELYQQSRRRSIPEPITRIQQFTDAAASSADFFSTIPAAAQSADVTPQKRKLPNDFESSPSKRVLAGQESPASLTDASTQVSREPPATPNPLKRKLNELMMTPPSPAKRVHTEDQAVVQEEFDVEGPSRTEQAQNAKDKSPRTVLQNQPANERSTNRQESAGEVDNEMPLIDMSPITPQQHTGSTADTQPSSTASVATVVRGGASYSLAQPLCALPAQLSARNLEEAEEIGADAASDVSETANTDSEHSDETRVSIESGDEVSGDGDQSIAVETLVEDHAVRAEVNGTGFSEPKGTNNENSESIAFPSRWSVPMPAYHVAGSVPARAVNSVGSMRLAAIDGGNGDESGDSTDTENETNDHNQDINVEADIDTTCGEPCHNRDENSGPDEARDQDGEEQPSKLRRNPLREKKDAVQNTSVADIEPNKPRKGLKPSQPVSNLPNTVKDLKMAIQRSYTVAGLTMELQFVHAHDERPTPNTISMQNSSSMNRAILTPKSMDKTKSIVRKIISYFPSSLDDNKVTKRELGLVKMLYHQEEEWHDFNTLEDVTTALKNACENHQDLKVLADLDFFATLNVMSVARPALYKKSVDKFNAYDYRLLDVMKCVHFVIAGLDKQWHTKHVFAAIYLQRAGVTKLMDLFSPQLIPAAVRLLQDALNDKKFKDSVISAISAAMQSFEVKNKVFESPLARVQRRLAKFVHACTIKDALCYPVDYTEDYNKSLNGSSRRPLPTPQRTPGSGNMTRVPDTFPLDSPLLLRQARRARNSG